MQTRDAIPPAGPVIGPLTCRPVNGVLWLFDREGRRLDMMREITVRQAINEATTATVVLLIDMEGET